MVKSHAFATRAAPEARAPTPGLPATMLLMANASQQQTWIASWTPGQSPPAPPKTKATIRKSVLARSALFNLEGCRGPRVPLESYGALGTGGRDSDRSFPLRSVLERHSPIKWSDPFVLRRLERLLFLQRLLNVAVQCTRNVRFSHTYSAAHRRPKRPHVAT